jgi:hypothetical protein
MCKRILLTNDNAAVFKPGGKFTLWSGIELWEQYPPVATPFECYIFDLQDVDRVTLAGRKGFGGFLRWSEAAEVSVILVNVRQQHIRDLDADGLPVNRTLIGSSVADGNKVQTNTERLNHSG